MKAVITYARVALIIRVVRDGFSRTSTHIMTLVISKELSMQDSANGIITVKGLSQQRLTYLFY